MLPFPWCIRILTFAHATFDHAAVAIGTTSKLPTIIPVVTLGRGSASLNGGLKATQPTLGSGDSSFCGFQDGGASIAT
jgi:hypothetical protein